MPFTHSTQSNVERKTNGLDKYDGIIDSPINLDVSTSAEGRPMSLFIILKDQSFSLGRLFKMHNARD